jgi:hypothetical protein
MARGVEHPLWQVELVSSGMDGRAGHACRSPRISPALLEVDWTSCEDVARTIAGGSHVPPVGQCQLRLPLSCTILYGLFRQPEPHRGVRFSDKAGWLLLDSRVVELPMAYNSTFVILSSLKPLFFNGLKKEFRFSDNGGV